MEAINNNSFIISYIAYPDSVFVEHPNTLIEEQSNHNSLQFSFNLNSLLSNNIGENINEITDLVKCYICLDKIKHPKMCRFCHRLACSECIRKWLDRKNTCGFCRHQITRFDFTEVPFMESIEKLIDNYKNLEEKNINLEKINEKLKEKLNSDKCSLHNEKILYYCFNCNKKLCGKCMSFINKEAKIHEFHKVFELSEIKMSKYMEVINLLENAKEQMDDTDKYLKKCEEIKENNKKKLNKEIYILDHIYKDIENNFIKINKINSDNSKKLISFQKQFNKELNAITNKLQKIESLDKPLTNFNILQEKKNVKSSKEELIKMEQKINNDFQKNIYVELKSFNYIFNQKYEKILKEKTISINIENPLKINFTLELIDNDILYIFFPISLFIEKEILSIKKRIKINLMPLLKINGKIKEFIKEKKTAIDNMMIKNINKNKRIEYDEEDDKEINNIINSIGNKKNNKNIIIEKNNSFSFDENVNENDNMEYVLTVKLNELIKNDNRFEFFIYYYYFYE